MSEISDLIAVLQKSNLSAKCPQCGDTSNLSEFVMWDGTAKHPDKAKKIIKNKLSCSKCQFYKTEYCG